MRIRHSILAAAVVCSLLGGSATVAALRAEAAALAVAGWPAPPALPPKQPVIDDYSGVKVTDPYRYFETPGNPVLAAFFKSENAYARAVLAKLDPARQALFDRIKLLDNSGTSVSSVQIAGNFYFYEKRNPGENTTKLYVRTIGAQDERVLIDPEKLVEKPGQHFTIEFYLPSYDGSHVAYGVSEGGSENAVIHVVETATGTILPDAIDRVKFGGPTAWLPDGKSFAYIRFPKLAPGESPNDGELKAVSYLHELGRDPDQDPALFGYGVDPDIAIQPTDFPFVTLSPTSPYALGIIAHGVQNEQTVYVAPAASIGTGKIPWKKIIDVGDDVTGLDYTGHTLFLLSHKDAPTFKVLSLDLAAPDIAAATTLVPASRAIVQAIGVAKDGLYVRSRDGGFGALQRIALSADGAPTLPPAAVTLPYQGTVDSLVTDSRVDGALFSLTSWTKSLAIDRVDSTGTVTNTGLHPAAKIDTSPYTSREDLATSEDGTKVPISIIYPKNLVLDGSHPTYLEGYGAYGIEIDPGFLGASFAWLQEGGVYAVCHPRGGGWFGEDWHRAGMIATKQHTIDDFVACARYLIAQKYTSPAHLAGEGTSAGGITIGRAITEHPELFAAALDVVGVSDAVRSEFTPNGPPNIPEFGSVKNPDQVKALLNMDAYLNVHDGTRYPAVMLITGINDPRVSSWELAKFTARLQEASTSGRPILLRVDYDAGHGFLDSSRKQTESLLTDQFAFLLWQLGDPAFAADRKRIVVVR
jgi:prolyl oligopeptidase